MRASAGVLRALPLGYRVLCDAVPDHRRAHLSDSAYSDWQYQALALIATQVLRRLVARCLEYQAVAAYRNSEHKAVRA